MYPYLTPYITNEPGSLSERAARFLTEKSVRRAPEWPMNDKQEVLESYSESFDGNAVEYYDYLQFLRMRVGGLSYFHPGLGFEGMVTFQPDAEIDPEDTEPYVQLVGSPDISVSVLASMSGEIHYLAEVDEDVNIVPVFSSLESLIESAAIHDESASWETVARGDDDIDLIEERASGLSIIPDSSGLYESWWEDRGIRVHVCRTFAAARGDSSSGFWAVLVRDSSLVEEAYKLLR